MREKRGLPGTQGPGELAPQLRGGWAGDSHHPATGGCSVAGLPFEGWGETGIQNLNTFYFIIGANSKTLKRGIFAKQIWPMHIVGLME